MTGPLLLPPVPPPGDHPATDPIAVMQLADGFSLSPLPTPYELRRERDVTGVSGTGVVAAGVIFPLDGGAVYRWCSARPPANYPRRVQQAGVFDSIAEVLAVHGHDGATVLHTRDATEPVADTDFWTDHRSRPETFAVVDADADVLTWGAWYADRDRAITWHPERTPRGRRQYARHEQWRSVTHVGNLATAAGHRMIWLASEQGRDLAAQVRAMFAESLRRARQVYAAATQQPGRPFRAPAGD